MNTESFITDLIILILGVCLLTMSLLDCFTDPSRIFMICFEFGSGLFLMILGSICLNDDFRNV